MTEDIDATPRRGSSREPSSAALDIARLKERHNALRDNVDDMGATVMEIKSLLLSHITNAGERHAQLLATFNQHNLEDSVVHQRVLRLTDEMESLQAESKRDPVTFWTSVAAGAVAVGAIVTALFGGAKP